MPIVGFGTWQLAGSAAYDALRHALDAGYRHIDTATMYGNERQVGRALRDSGLAREQVFVTTKLPPDRAGREHETLTASLRELGTDYVDLWLVHWPPRGRARPETWQRFIEARTDGLARAIGVSNYSTAQIDELTTATGVTPAVDQIRWGPTLYDPVRAAELARREVALEGYSPFKSSDLHEPLLSGIAEGHGVTAAQVILRWHLEHGVAVIPKSAHPPRIEANIDIFGFRLTGDEIASIDRLAG
jgi:diketogulonate reductase-like aldo/keto reductase